MSIFEHQRFEIWNAGQHPYKHDLSDFFYSNPSAPGVSNVGSAIDWIMKVLYPNTKAAVANVAALPSVGNVINDYRVVTDDGDGKAASYRWEQREGDSAAKWYKVYDMDWGSDSILTDFITKTQDNYVFRRGYDDLDSTGTVVTGTYGGQTIYGGATANKNLTLKANAGDGTGSQTGFVQVDDNFRPAQNNTWDIGTSALIFKNFYIGTILAANGSTSLPSFSFVNAPSYGMSATASSVFISAAGTAALTFSSTQTSLFSNTMSVQANISLNLGADNGASTLTDATAKRSTITTQHYTNAQLPMGTILGDMTSGNSDIYIGGGATTVNAATRIFFYTGATTTTAAGTQQGSISSAGLWTIGASGGSQVHAINGSISATGAGTFTTGLTVVGALGAGWVSNFKSTAAAKVVASFWNTDTDVNSGGVEVFTTHNNTGNGNALGVYNNGTSSPRALFQVLTAGTIKIMANASSFDSSGNFNTNTAGVGIKIKEGTNARMGTAVLNGTTAVVIANTSVTASTRIFLSIVTPGGTVGGAYVSAVVAATSFSIKSTNAADTSTVAYLLVEAN